MASTELTQRETKTKDDDPSWYHGERTQVQLEIVSGGELVFEIEGDRNSESEIKTTIYGLGPGEDDCGFHQSLDPLKSLPEVYQVLCEQVSETLAKRESLRIEILSRHPKDIRDEILP